MYCKTKYNRFILYEPDIWEQFLSCTTRLPIKKRTITFLNIAEGLACSMRAEAWLDCSAQLHSFFMLGCIHLADSMLGYCQPQYSVCTDSTGGEKEGGAKELLRTWQLILGIRPKVSPSWVHGSYKKLHCCCFTKNMVGPVCTFFIKIM